MVSPLILFFVFLSLFKKIRFGIIRSQRIGHTLANTEFYLIDKKIQSSHINLDIIYKAKEIANNQSLIMVKR